LDCEDPFHDQVEVERILIELETVLLSPLDLLYELHVMEICLFCDAQFATHTWKYLQVYGESETDRSNDESYAQRLLSQDYTDATSWIMFAEGTDKSKMFHRENASFYSKSSTALVVR